MQELPSSVEGFSKEDAVIFDRAGPDRIAAARALGKEKVLEILAEFNTPELLKVRGSRRGIDLDDLVYKLGSREIAEIFAYARLCCGGALSDHDISPGCRVSRSVTIDNVVGDTPAPQSACQSGVPLTKNASVTWAFQH